MDGLEHAEGIQQQSKRPVPDRFVCEFRADFKGLGMSLDVDDEGRLVVQEVEEDGEAASFADLQQGNLCIVTVGVDRKHPKQPADELLQRLMTLPRPVSVEFAVTVEPPTTAAVEADAEAVKKSPRDQSLNAKELLHHERQKWERSDGSLVDEGKATANVALRPSHTPGPASAKAPVDVCFVGEASKAHRRLPREDAAPSTQTPAELEDHPGTTSFPDGDTDQTSPPDRSEDRGDAATEEISSEDADGHVDEWRIDKQRGSDARSQRLEMVVGGTSWEENLRKTAAMMGHAHHVDDNGDDEVDTSRQTRKGFESDKTARACTPRVPEPVMATPKNRKVVERSGDVVPTPNGSESSAHPWLQKDSDCGDANRDGLPVKQTTHTDEREACNHQRMPPKGGVGESKHRSPSKKSPAGDYAAHDGDGGSIQGVALSATAGGKKPTDGGRLAADAIPSSPSFSDSPSGVVIRTPGKSYYNCFANEAPQSSIDKSGWERPERFGSAGCGSTMIGVSLKHEGSPSQSNLPRRENVSPPVTIPSQPATGPSATRLENGGIDKQSPSRAVQGEGDISPLIQNHIPFMLGWSEGVGAVNEGAAGRGSLAATVEPLLRLPHTDRPAAIFFGNAPSSGPANARAMYGRVPAPTLPGSGVIRVPSVIVLPEKSTEDEHRFRRSWSDTVQWGAGRSARSVPGARRSASRGDGGGSGRGGGGGGGDGGVESEKPVGSSQIRSPYARDGIVSKVDRIEPTRGKTKAHEKARTLQAQMRLSDGGKRSRSRGDSYVGVGGGGAAATRRKRSGCSTAVARRARHPNKVQRDAGGLFTNDDDDIPSSPPKMSWERQLRTDIGPKNQPDTTAARPRKDYRKRPSGSCLRLGEASGEKQKEAQSVGKIKDTLDSAYKNSSSARQILASPSAKPVADACLATGPWSRLRVDVDHVPTRIGARESTGCQASEGAEENRQNHCHHGSEAEDEKQQEEVNEQDCKKEEKREGETTLDREESGTSAPVRAKVASETGNAETISRGVCSKSQGPARHAPRAAGNATAAGGAASGAATATATTATVAAAAAAAAAAATASIAAASEGCWKGFPKGRAAANATEAPARSSTLTSADAKQKRSVARVRVRVRSSVYVLVAYLDERGSLLLNEVVEAEKHRHGARAARVVGLTNESTGNPVDLNVPARRSLSSGDALVAVVATMTSDGRGEVGFVASAESVSGKAPGKVGKEDRPEVMSREHAQPVGDKPTRQRPKTSGDTPNSSRILAEDTKRGGGRSPQQRSTKPKPSRCIASPRDIDQLRDDVARRFFTERQAAGEGVGALRSPFRLHDLPPTSPVTGKGRGASPENSRVTSPRSASPRGALKWPERSTEGGGEGKEESRPASPARSARSVASGYTNFSCFSLRSHGRAARSEKAFLAQSTLTPKELGIILKEELVKSHKWSARHRTAQEKVRRVWEERGLDHDRRQRAYEKKEAERRKEIRQRQKVEAQRMAARNRRLAELAESARQHARDSRNTKESRAKEAEAVHQKRLLMISEQKDREKREHARKVHMMGRRREDVRDSFLDLVDNEKETAIQALETPLEILERAVGEGDNKLEKKARRAILRRQAKERVSLRQKASRVLAEQRRRESVVEESSHTREAVESRMRPGPGQYNIRDFSEFGGGIYSRPLV